MGGIRAPPKRRKDQAIAMTRHEMELLLAVIKQHMDQDLRGKVMREVPLAYNAWCGRDVVQITRVSDNKRF